MTLEQYDRHTFKQCKRLFDKFTGKLGEEGMNLPNTTSLVRKYASSGALSFDPQAIQNVRQNLASHTSQDNC